LLAEAFIDNTLGFSYQVRNSIKIGSSRQRTITGEEDIKYSVGGIIAFPTSRATRSELSVDQRVKAWHICPINQKTKNGRYTKESLVWPVTFDKPSIR